MQEMRVQSLGWEDPLEESVTAHSSSLAWRTPMDRGAWRAMAHGFMKSRTRLKWLSTFLPLISPVSHSCVPCDMYPCVPLIFALFWSCEMRVCDSGAPKTGFADNLGSATFPLKFSPYPFVSSFWNQEASWVFCSLSSVSAGRWVRKGERLECILSIWFVLGASLDDIQTLGHLGWFLLLHI